MSEPVIPEEFEEPKPLEHEPPIQGDRCVVPDGREGLCFSVSPGKDNLAPWALVHFSSDTDLERYGLAELTRLPE